MNNFIKLTDLDKGTTLMLNSTFIQSISEQVKGSYIIMTFKDNYSHYKVKETIDEIMKQIEKSNWITTRTI